MLSNLEPSVALFSLAALLILAISTISLCKKDKYRPESPTDHLFHGHSFMHSVISNMGAIFSVTYFFGATFIYSAIYASWTLAIAVVIVLSSVIVIVKIVSAVHITLPPNQHNRHRGNILLLFLEKQLTRRDYTALTRVLILVYFGLLIEELAVSRVILEVMFQSQYALTVFVLATVILVSITYVYVGGFRAVLISDYVQGAVLLVFVGVLFTQIATSSGSSPLRSPDARTLPDWVVLPSLIVWSFFGVTWLTLAIDFYSRLNIDSSPDQTIGRARFRLALLSLSGTLVIVLVGSVFSYAAAQDLSGFADATDYFQRALSVFLGSRSTFVIVTFLVGLFCMIFTTVDTLMLTLLQVSHEAEFAPISREKLTGLMVVATFFSVLVPDNAVCAYGIFAGSLLLIAAPVVFREVFKTSFFRFFRSDPTYFAVATVVACTAFGFSFHNLESRFEWHFVIPGIVIFSAILATAVSRVISRIRQEAA